MDLPPCGQARLWRPIGPQFAKKRSFCSPPHQGQKIADFLFGPLFRPAGVVFAVHALLALFWAGMLFGDVGRTRKAKCNLGCRKTLCLEKLADLWHIWPHSQEEGHIHTCSWGRLQGHLSVIPTIDSCFYGPLWLVSFSVSGLLPHTGFKISPQNTFFLPNAPLLVP